MEKIEVTQAQKALLNLLKPSEVKDYYNSLKKIHYLGTYSVDIELVELSESAYVQQLLDSIQKIVIENN